MDANTRFTSVDVYFDLLRDHFSVLTAVDSDGTSYAWEFVASGELDPDNPRSSADDLATLRAIHASAAGLLDALGGAVTPSISGPWPHGSDLASIADNGYVNPLDGGGEEKLARVAAYNAALLNELQAVTENSETGRPDVTLTMGFKPQRRATAALTGSLRDWSAIQHQTGFNLMVPIHAADGVTADNAGGFYQIRSLLTWLETLRYDGDAMDVTSMVSLTDVATTLSNRKFRLVQSDSLTIEFHFALHSLADTQYFLRAVHEASSATVDIGLLNTMLDTATATITPARDDEKPPFGDVGVPVYGERFHFDDGSWLERGLGGHLIYKGADPDGTAFRTNIGGEGRTIMYDDLPVVSTRKSLPTGFHQNTIHFGPDASSVGTVRFAFPDSFPMPPGDDQSFRFVNLDDEHNLQVQWTDGSCMVCLKPDETVTFRVIRRPDGVYEVIDDDSLRRTLSVDGANHANFGTVTQMEIGTTRSGRPFPMPNDTDTVFMSSLDADAFEIGSGTYPADTAIADMTEAQFHTAHSIKVLKAGRLHIDFTGVFRADGGQGTLPDCALVLYEREPSGNVLDRFRQPVGTMRGGGEPIAVFARTSIDVAAGDIFMPVLRYATTNGITSFGEVFASNYHLDMTLDQRVRLVHSG